MITWAEAYLTIPVNEGRRLNICIYAFDYDRRAVMSKLMM